METRKYLFETRWKQYLTEAANGKLLATELTDFATKQYQSALRSRSTVDYSGILAIVQKITDQATYNMFNNELFSLTEMNICQYINDIMHAGDTNYKEICDYLAKFQGGKAACFKK